MNGANFDPRTALGGGISIKPGTTKTGAGATSGDWVDCGDLNVSPVVSALCMIGASGGEEAVLTTTFKLQEADTSGGSGAQDIPVKEDVVLASDGTKLGYATGRRTKQFVRVVGTLVVSDTGTGTGGTPAQPMSAAVLALKENAG